MDYKKALLPTIVLPPTRKPVTLAKISYATPEEQDEIIEELRLSQSRPELVTPRVDTTLVDKEIKEKYARNQGYYSQMEIAVSVGIPAARQWLVEQLHNPEMFQEALETLKEYIANNDSDKVEQLLQWTASDAVGNSCLIRYRDRFNTSYAHLTLENPEMLSLVLAAGANPNAQDRDGLTPLHKATLSGNLDSIKMLLIAGAHPEIKVTNRVNPWIETPLLSAIFKFNGTRHADTQYHFFKIAAHLIINKDGNGEHARSDTKNSKGVSAQAYVQQIPGNNKELNKLRDLMYWRDFSKDTLKHSSMAEKTKSWVSIN
jgi:hypothetical protein